MTKSLLFSGTLLISSALVFLVEFTCAKMVLPLLGGSPGVWNTCLVFFQAGLLVGYGYAHLAPNWLGVSRHFFVHLALWLLAVVYLLFIQPIDLGSADRPPGEGAPILWLLGLLAVSIGFPFVLLSSCGPLLQRWYASSAEGNNPYFLYTASNVGSMLGLLLYPFVIEPSLTLLEQGQAWTWGFVILTGLFVLCGMWLNKPNRLRFSEVEIAKSPAAVADISTSILAKPQAAEGAKPQAMGADISTSQRVRWLLLALVPSSLMLSVTTYLTTDIAPVPLLWMLPLALYLGSFVLVFGWQLPSMQSKMARWLPAVVLLVLVVPLAEGTEPILIIMALHLFAFFWIATVCHHELARSKPPAQHLTEFYLWLAIGGVVGGMCNALVAPVVFNTVIEYPLMLILASWLGPREVDVRANLPSRWEWPQWPVDLIAPALIGLLTLGLVFVIGNNAWFDRTVRNLINKIVPELVTTEGTRKIGAALMFLPPALLCLLAAEKHARYSLCLIGLVLAASFYGGVHGKPIYRLRSFFGVHRVTEGVDRDNLGYRYLIHGDTSHGVQDPRHPKEPITYYYRQGPIGKFFTNMSENKDPRLQRVGIIGLGAGTLACYSEKGQKWTFFEIDPAVKRIAENPKLFTFLRDFHDQVDVVLGDGRLTLKDNDDKFGVLMIDAFGSDAIPTHLLTREALQIYRDRLQPGGVIVFHISNRYFRLEPVLANLAADAGWECLIQEDLRKKETDRYPSTWVLMAENRADVARFRLVGFRQATRDPNLRVWTDDFSNVFQILKWRDD